jgi:glucuronokinase
MRSMLVNENFDLRRSVFNLPPWQIQMVETARLSGASAKFAGSGDAIVGFSRDAATLKRLSTVLGAIGSRVIIPGVC